MMNQQQLPPRPLEEVLRDPTADWDEIRSAIKGRRGSAACTNVAIMQALANERSWAAAAVATAIVMKEEQRGEQINQNHEEQVKLELSDSGDFGNDGGSISNYEVDNEIEVLTTTLPLDNDLKMSHDSTENGNNIKSSFRMSRGRRGSGSMATFRRSGRRRGTRRNSGSFLTKTSFKAAASVNIMDFGVIESILDLSDSNGSGNSNKNSSDNNFKESDEFSDDVSKSGFMGWKHHDDISLRSSHTLDKSFQLGGSDNDSIILSEGDAEDLKASYSNLVDSSGFLDWRHSVRRRSRSSFVDTVDEDEDAFLDWRRSLKKQSSLRSSFIDTVDEVEEGAFLDWRHSLKKQPSLRSSFIDTVDEVEDEGSCSNKETWNIADYDGPDDYVRSSDHKPMRALSDRLRRFGSHKTDVGRKQDISIDDIKRALLSVRNREDNEQEQPPFRRPTMCGVPDAAPQPNQEEQKPTNRTRRKTVVGNVAMLGAVLNYLPKNNGENREENHVDAEEPKKKTRSRRKTIMEGISPFVGMKKEQVEKDASSPTHDDREAIWISRKDGNVDIEKECRKLYGDLDSFSAHSS